MERLAILDHTSHTLFIEDVSDEDIEKYGGEQEYIDDNYTFEGDYSWEYIVDAEYFPQGESMPMEIDFENL